MQVQPAPFDVRQLVESLSVARLAAYGITASPELKAEDFAPYFWNVALCEALYPSLQSLEVALRNRLDIALATSAGLPAWYDRQPAILDVQQQKSVAEVIGRLAGQGRQASHGHIIAELTFGFWTSLFDKRYEQVLWPNHLTTAVPYLPRKLRTRKYVSKRLHTVRKIRNRVFHHEPISRWPDLAQRHAEIIEAIGWFSPELQRTVMACDRFPAVITAGIQPIAFALTQLSGAK